MVLLARLSELSIAVGVVGVFDPSHPASFLCPPFSPLTSWHERLVCNVVGFLSCTVVFLAILTLLY